MLRSFSLRMSFYLSFVFYFFLSPVFCLSMKYTSSPWSLTSYTLACLFSLFLFIFLPVLIQFWEICFGAARSSLFHPIIVWQHHRSVRIPKCSMLVQFASANCQCGCLIPVNFVCCVLSQCPWCPHYSIPPSERPFTGASLHICFLCFPFTFAFCFLSSNSVILEDFSLWC